MVSLPTTVLPFWTNNLHNFENSRGLLILNVHTWICVFNSPLAELKCPCGNPYFKIIRKQASGGNIACSGHNVYRWEWHVEIFFSGSPQIKRACSLLCDFTLDCTAVCFLLETGPSLATTCSIDAVLYRKQHPVCTVVEIPIGCQQTGLDQESALPCSGFQQRVFRSIQALTVEVEHSLVQNIMTSHESCYGCFFFQIKVSSQLNRTF